MLMLLCYFSGKLYNHVGLHYAETMCFHQAGKYFIKAMQICSGANFSIRKRAVLLQNLGAVYNALCQYEISLRYHGEAADLYGEVSNTWFTQQGAQVYFSPKSEGSDRNLHKPFKIQQGPGTSVWSGLLERSLLLLTGPSLVCPH